MAERPSYGIAVLLVTEDDQEGLSDASHEKQRRKSKSKS